jgi:hypothetical protein
VNPRHAGPTGGSPFQAHLTGNLDINVLLGFVFGVVFLALMLAFSIFFPNPTGWQIKIWITTLALAAAGIGAVLPGFLEVKYKSVIRATGALALFVIVYLFQPAIERSVPSFPEPTADPVATANKILEALDRGDVATAYNMFDPEQRQAITLTTFESMYRNVRAPSGPAVSRILEQTQNLLNPPGLPPGRYQYFGFSTKFATDCRTETVGVKADQSLSWVIWSYLITPTPTPCLAAQ